MSDIKLGSDIRILNGEIALGYEDVGFVEGEECLLQDIRNKLFTDIGALYYDPSYGSRVLRYIQGERDDFTLQELKQTIKIALKTDERIVSNSIGVSFNTSSEKLGIMIEFKTIENEKLTIEESL